MVKDPGVISVVRKNVKNLKYSLIKSWLRDWPDDARQPNVCLQDIKVLPPAGKPER